MHWFAVLSCRWTNWPNLIIQCDWNSETICLSYQEPFVSWIMWSFSIVRFNLNEIEWINSKCVNVECHDQNNFHYEKSLWRCHLWRIHVDYRTLHKCLCEIQWITKLMKYSDWNLMAICRNAPDRIHLITTVWHCSTNWTMNLSSYLWWPSKRFCSWLMLISSSAMSIWSFAINIRMNWHRRQVAVSSTMISLVNSSAFWRQLRIGVCSI